MVNVVTIECLGKGQGKTIQVIWVIEYGGLGWDSGEDEKK